jgi:hypothetical protein
MEMDKYNQHLIIRVTEYGLTHQRFALIDIKNDLKLNNAEFDYVLHTLTQLSKTFTDSPNHILVGADLVQHKISSNVDWKRSTYSLLPNAFYNYVDYLEIKEARKQSIEAKNQSNMALQVAVYSLLASILLGLFSVFLSVIQIIK